MRSLLRLIFSAWLRPVVAGLAADLPRERLVVIANHESGLDGLLIAAALPVPATVVFGRDALQFPLVRRLARLVPHVELDLSEPASLRQLTRVLDAGGNVIVFPQGRISTVGGHMLLYGSVATLVTRPGVSVVIAHLAGTRYTICSRLGGRSPRRLAPRVRLTFAEPETFPEATGLSASARRRQAAERLAARMQSLAVESRPRRTLFASLVDAVEVFGRRFRIVEDPRAGEQTYGRLLMAALALGRLGARATPGDTAVGVLMPNLAVTAALVLGLSSRGRVPALLNYTAGAESVRSACTVAGVRTVITSRAFVETARLGHLVEALKDRRVLYLEDLRAGFGTLDRLWLLAWALWRPRACAVAAAPDDTGVILFTSGSEGQPKGVALSHDAILSNILQMQAVMDVSANDRFLSALPMFHSYGLTAGVLMPLVSGIPVYIYPTPLHYRVLPEIAYQRDCTFIFGTSTFLGQYARHAQPFHFYRIRVPISGAEKLDPEVARLWQEKFGLRIMEGYGSTECAPVLALNTLLAYKPRTVGRFLPGIEHRVVPVPGIAHGGLLHVRGPNLMRGYYTHEQPGVIDPPRSEVGEGWYNTGDVVDVDAEGYVTVVGRVKRFAKIAGEMIALESVERIAAHASPAHRHAATIETVAGSGESTALFTTDPELNRGTLHHAARELGAPDLAVARRVVHVAELPLLGSGKIDYVQLRLLAEERRHGLSA
jgi:acyl-[acyl-carrier-protein]-phospholipid O-acyltransferase/long-chain-fatty-acid--[acyl-carrier-protein] ligase